MISSKLDNLFQQFAQEKTYLCNLSPTTVDFYRRSYKAFALPENLGELNQAQLNTAIVSMRSAGISPASTNAYSRGLQVFLNWLLENQFIEQQLKLKKSKVEDKPVRTFSDSEVAKLLSYKPGKKSEKRLLAILAVMVDTGLRVSECLGLRRKNISLDSCLLDVVGKGGRYRKIPFSIQCRKVLYRHLQTHNFDLVFCNKNGGPLHYQNLRCELKALQQKLGISVEGAWHQTRRFWASFAARHGLGTFLIQKNLGHARVTTTQRYIRLDSNDLQKHHVSALQGGLR